MIDIKSINCFDAAAIADSGQVFRAEIKPNGVHFISGGEYAIVKNGEIICTNDDYFTKYFDLETDYENIKNTAVLPQKIKDPSSGIRILNGDIVEIIISFIISANNNIKRIKKTIAALCERFGTPHQFTPTHPIDFPRQFDPEQPVTPEQTLVSAHSVTVAHQFAPGQTITYYAFPTLDALTRITADDFKTMGCGYRAEYLVKTAAALQAVKFDEWQKLNDDELYQQIIKLHGVGDKVARCIMLFAFHRLNIIPVDTWIIKTAGNFVDVVGKTPKTVAVELQKYFGAFGGIAQQYIFYYTQFLKQNID
ncbi:MAG: hypothetical protein LBQ05_03235 [Christensenellaceae bacterium]|jgi:N-glycosylase/DNA lyase|nr:hypothetical protein [Christensenellaceae bacterium]